MVNIEWYIPGGGRNSDHCLNLGYRVMQSDRNSFGRNVVLDSVNMSTNSQCSKKHLFTDEQDMVCMFVWILFFLFFLCWRNYFFNKWDYCIMVLSYSQASASFTRLTLTCTGSLVYTWGETGLGAGYYWIQSLDLACLHTAPN